MEIQKHTNGIPIQGDPFIVIHSLFQKTFFTFLRVFIFHNCKSLLSNILEIIIFYHYVLGFFNLELQHIYLIRIFIWYVYTYIFDFIFWSKILFGVFLFINIKFWTSELFFKSILSKWIQKWINILRGTRPIHQNIKFKYLIVISY